LGPRVSPNAMAERQVFAGIKSFENGRFEVFMAVTLEFVVLWLLVQCSNPENHEFNHLKMFQNLNICEELQKTEKKFLKKSDED